MTSKPATGYKNVMEIVVDEEIDRQTQHYAPELAQFLNRVELATYALNRLPPLYASSREGFNFQYERAKYVMQDQVKIAVEQALMTIQESPQRPSTPF